MKPWNPMNGGQQPNRGKSSSGPKPFEASSQHMPPPWMTPTPPEQRPPQMGGGKSAQPPAMPERTNQRVSGGMQ